MKPGPSREGEIHEGKIVRLFRTGVNWEGNHWCSIEWRNRTGHLNFGLAASEIFDLDLVPHCIGLTWRFQERPSKKYKVEYKHCPLAEQPEDSIQEATLAMTVGFTFNLK